ncbi:ABC transporter ATP-binding protein [Pokkaliibacter sp. MBI-7]|uniref:ABC transporter ATP-binding protein n=1 Tax=Pokkaliibacter sp. MBI-7 TaxID=3040600 RepID=UPI00244D2F06|nr:ABC transporter ATP-binding protein [Pokkaliibacter sp. MBI-7]MDH2433117.1 ABC transporter ATP-binding protein [Pokkaliibacter sp. MBI-7]
MSQLSIQHLSKAFGHTAILRDINLEVEQGSFLTLLGPSGCGKTTLLRIIAGLEQADQGRIQAGQRTFVDCAAGVELSPQQRRLGFVFQDYGLWPHMSVADNVAFPLQMARVSRHDIAARVREVLTAVRLQQHADKLPEKLSGGQKQRVSIARALAAKPGLILFDEPLSNLDANLREELGQEIRLLSKQLGLTCINVTHDRREAQILSDQIALMKDGLCHQLGAPEQLFRAPVDLWAARFLDAGNILPAATVMGEPRGTEQQVLVPRGAFRLAEDAPLQAAVISSLYIDDRYEVTASLDGHLVKVFTHQHLQQGQPVRLAVDHQQVLSYTAD